MESMTQFRFRAFTLLEVLMAVTIFLLLAGGIFAAVSTATRTATDLTLARLQSERIDGLHRFLSHLCANLPATSTVELRVDSSREKSGSPELLISPAPAFTDFSSSHRSGGLVLGLTKNEQGVVSFSAANFDASLSGPDRDKDILRAPWIFLLPDVVRTRWRFQSQEQAGWQETWAPGQGRPVLAEFELVLSDGSTELWQFAIPRIQKPAQPKESPAP
jgi:prepilin-type N-terminal cleavage/methylation domain-containing protein